MTGPVRLLIGVILAGGLIALLFNRQLVEHLDVRLGYAILAAQPALFVTQALMGHRFRTIVGPEKGSFSDCLQASLLVQASDVVLPAKSSEVIRIAYLRQKLGIEFASGLASVVFERVTDLIVVAVLIAFGALVVAEANAGIFIAVAFVAGVGLFFLPRLHPMLDRLIRMVPFERLQRFAASFLDEVVVRRRDGRLFRVLVPTLMIWLLGLSATWAFLTVSGVLSDPRVGQASMLVVLTVFVLTTVGNAIAVLPASIGTYEAGVVAALGLFGIPFDESLTLGFALHLAHMLLGLIGGGLVFAANWRVLWESVARFRRPAT